jgi:hypothetical protein
MNEAVKADYAICPKCAGSTRRPYPTEHDPDRRYAEMTATYDKLTDTLACNNCGGQFMSLRATGYTKKRPGSNDGCLHEFVGRNAGNCYTEYSCKHCALSYAIDSSD